MEVPYRIAPPARERSETAGLSAGCGRFGAGGELAGCRYGQSAVVALPEIGGFAERIRCTQGWVSPDIGPLWGWGPGWAVRRRFAAPRGSRSYSSYASSSPLPVSQLQSHRQLRSPPADARLSRRPHTLAMPGQSASVTSFVLPSSRDTSEASDISVSSCLCQSRDPVLLVLDNVPHRRFLMPQKDLRDIWWRPVFTMVQRQKPARCRWWPESLYGQLINC